MRASASTCFKAPKSGQYIAQRKAEIRKQVAEHGVDTTIEKTISRHMLTNAKSIQSRSVANNEWVWLIRIIGPQIFFHRKLYTINP